MPKLKCRCGYVHDLSPIPDDGWITVKDKEYEELLRAEATRTEIEDAVTLSNEAEETLLAADQTTVNLTGLLYECPDCDRVMWQKPGQSVFRTYIEESNV
jgi:hypothetical protein